MAINMELFNIPKFECPGCLRRFSEMGMRAHSKFCKNNVKISRPVQIKHVPSEPVSLGNPSWHETVSLGNSSWHETVSLGNSSWPEFLEMLRQSRDDDPFSDVTVVTSERDLLSCHCLILAAASPVLADLLDIPSREDESVLIVSENMSTRLWRNLLDLLYTGEVMVEGDMLVDLKKVLDIYNIQFCAEVENNVKEEIDVFDHIIYTEPFDNCEIELNGDDIIDLNEKEEEIITKNSNFIDFQEKDAQMSKNELLVLANHLKEKNGIGEIINNGHKNMHQGLKPFKCRYCDKCYHYHSNTMQHEKKIHPELYVKKLVGNVPAEKIQCDYCDFIQPSLGKIKWHVKKSHSEKFEEFSDKYEHYGCDLCTKKFLDKKLRMIHKKKYHPNYKRGKRPRTLYPEDGLPWHSDRKCPHCDRIFNRLDMYDDHLKTHSSGHFPYSCNECKMKFKRAVSFRRHTKRHEPLEHPLLCIVCGESFLTEFEHRKHGKKQHPKYTKKVVPVVEPVPLTEELLCNLCGKSFKHKSNLKEHLRFAHVKEEDKFHCTECDFKTAIPTNFKRHKLLHKPPTLKCEHCDKMFHTEVYRRNHTRSNHTANHLKEFKCGQCGKGFTNIDVYNGHMNMHQGLKPFKCRYCDKCYQNHSNCMAHEKKIHPDLYVKRRNKDHLGGVRIAQR